MAVEKTDRLTRNMKDAVAIDDWLQDNPDRMLHAVKENLKLHKESKSDVKFMWNIHLAVAKKYTDNLREEAMKGWAEKLAQGHMPSRPPIGYMTAIQNGKRIHIPDPKITPIIQQAFDLYLQPNQTIATTQAFLAQAGVTTYTGRPLVLDAVHRLLKNRYYIGIIDFNNETYPGAHDPIISKEIFNAVQAKMHHKRPAKQRRLNPILKNILTCGYCSKTITWEKQKGHLYGACQRDLQECRNNKYLREELAHDTLIEKLDELICPSPEIVEWLVNQLENEYKTSNDAAEEYRKSLETKLERLSRMDEMLYDDKLAGDITKERYEAKHKSILEQIQTVKDDLSIADSTSAQRHEEAIDLIKLTQTAKDEYLDSDITSEAKRSILTELFESVTLKDNSVSVKYTFFAESVAKRSRKTKEIMEGQNMLNRTDKDSENNRGKINKKDLKNEIYPVWQGHVEYPQIYHRRVQKSKLSCPAPRYRTTIL
ncbi:hypothetical protein CL689_05725, partial [Candidatus Saccharibacteria bacterium]|nr:hypothetical protein [Candidatus Saccharibacteria bacterium]